jgi:hypothetical protein
MAAEKLPARWRREQRIRERAYFLWQQSGFPSGRDLDFWILARALEPRWLWPGRLRVWLISQKDAVSTIQALATVLALGVGAVLGYIVVTAPNVELSQVVTGKLIASRWYWIQISITAKNIGTRGILTFDTVDSRIEQITPLPEPIESDIKNDKDPVGATDLSIPWSGLCRYSRSFPLRLVPGESDTILVDFVIPAWLKTIRVYTYLGNISVNPTLGVSAATIYNLTGSNNDEAQGMEKLSPDNHRLCAYDS